MFISFVCYKDLSNIISDSQGFYTPEFYFWKWIWYVWKSLPGLLSLVYNLYCYLVLQVLVEALARSIWKGLVSNECKIYEFFASFTVNSNLIKTWNHKVDIFSSNMFSLNLADPSTSLRAPASYTLISAVWIRESDGGVAAAADPGRHRTTGTVLQVKPIHPNWSTGCKWRMSDIFNRN